MYIHLFLYSYIYITVSNEIMILSESIFSIKIFIWWHYFSNIHGFVREYDVIFIRLVLIQEYDSYLPTCFFIRDVFSFGFNIFSYFKKKYIYIYTYMLIYSYIFAYIYMYIDRDLYFYILINL